MVAASDKFTQGRRREIVCACCLYICCRLEKSPLMLIDFADTLQTNMYSLGSCFMRLKEAVDFPVQQRRALMTQDPSLYIHRFAAQLHFGNDDTHRVAITAIRLVGRMRRDWMTLGRRPSGICAAALLIASRMHGFQRSQHDVVQVCVQALFVGVCIYFVHFFCIIWCAHSQHNVVVQVLLLLHVHVCCCM